jgi:hypothetical protein
MVEIDSSYLTTKTSREEVERRFDFASAADEFREDWERLLSKVEPGDEYWNFEPPPEAMKGRIGKLYRIWGVALVRWIDQQHTIRTPPAAGLRCMNRTA